MQEGQTGRPKLKRREVDKEGVAAMRRKREGRARRAARKPDIPPPPQHTHTHTHTHTHAPWTSSLPCPGLTDKRHEALKEALLELFGLLCRHVGHAGLHLHVQ